MPASTRASTTAGCASERARAVRCRSYVKGVAPAHGLFIRLIRAGTVDRVLRKGEIRRTTDLWALDESYGFHGCSDFRLLVFHDSFTSFPFEFRSKNTGTDENSSARRCFTRPIDTQHSCGSGFLVPRYPWRCPVSTLGRALRRPLTS